MAYVHRVVKAGPCVEHKKMQSFRVHTKGVKRGPTDKRRINLHPTQKPVWLCEQMILTYTNEGQTVLDCCMGSGSIGVACKQTGRNYIGIDNDPHWVNVATQRIGQISQ